MLPLVLASEHFLVASRLLEKKHMVSMGSFMEANG